MLVKDDCRPFCRSTTKWHYQVSIEVKTKLVEHRHLSAQDGAAATAIFKPPSPPDAGSIERLLFFGQI